MATLYPVGLFGAPDPFRDLRRLQDEMERLVSGMAPGAGSLATAGGFPAVNVYAGQDGIAILAELPGVEKDDLEVHAHQDTLTLRGTRRTPRRRSRTPITATSAAAAPSAAASSCPTGWIPAGIQANLENGVLRLSLPRPEEDKPRRIAVN